jgi:hypothetical protein
MDKNEQREIALEEISKGIYEATQKGVGFDQIEKQITMVLQIPRLLKKKTSNWSLPLYGHIHLHCLKRMIHI